MLAGLISNGLRTGGWGRFDDATGGAVQPRAEPAVLRQGAGLRNDAGGSEDGYSVGGRGDDALRERTLGLDGASRRAPMHDAALRSSDGFASMRPMDVAAIDGARMPAKGRDLRNRELRRPRRNRKATRARRTQQRQRTKAQSTQARRTQAQRTQAQRTQRARRADAAPAATGTNRQRLDHAAERARALGLRVTSTTGGRHAPNSYHYRGRAIDVAGSPEKMAQFYREMAQLRPTELFYDPIGGIKNGQNIGPIGGHRTHVHVAF